MTRLGLGRQRADTLRVATSRRTASRPSPAISRGSWSLGTCEPVRRRAQEFTTANFGNDTCAQPSPQNFLAIGAVIQTKSCRSFSTSPHESPSVTLRRRLPSKVCRCDRDAQTNVTALNRLILAMVSVCGRQTVKSHGTWRSTHTTMVWSARKQVFDGGRRVSPSLYGSSSSRCPSSAARIRSRGWADHVVGALAPRPPSPKLAHPKRVHAQL